METLLKIKYVAPEVVDFKWMDSLGACTPNGSGADLCQPGGGATILCSSNGSYAGNTCTAQGQGV